MKYKLYILIAISILTGSLCSQSTGTIRGKVQGINDSTALSDILVSLAGTNYSAVTDKDGEYEMLNIPEGSYKLSAGSSAYYLNQKYDIVVNLDSVSIKDLSMHKHELIICGTIIELGVNLNGLSGEAALVLHKWLTIMKIR